ncbi:MAG: hypothetical protein JNL28_11005 [Planctomycetes bacterium]|nr:hypothetical protein [Planctomycetota bacterium]
MSESTWGESDSMPPPKKKAIPTWLWFCGGGCLLAVIAGIVVVTLLVSRFKGSFDPEVQWPKVAEVLPYDERPSELELKFGMDLGINMFVFDDSRGYAAILFSIPMRDESERDKLMDPNESGFLGMGQRKDAQASKLMVQGRELEVLRFHQMSDRNKSGGQGGAPEVGAGPSAMIELSKDTDPGFLFLQLVRLHSTEPVPDEAIQTFLKPFHVGPDR